MGGLVFAYIIIGVGEFVVNLSVYAFCVYSLVKGLQQQNKKWLLVFPCLLLFVQAGVILFNDYQKATIKETFPDNITPLHATPKHVEIISTNGYSFFETALEMLVETPIKTVTLTHYEPNAEGSLKNRPIIEQHTYQLAQHTDCATDKPLFQEPYQFYGICIEQVAKTQPDVRIYTNGALPEGRQLPTYCLDPETLFVTSGSGNTKNIIASRERCGAELLSVPLWVSFHETGMEGIPRKKTQLVSNRYFYYPDGHICDDECFINKTLKVKLNRELEFGDKPNVVDAQKLILDVMNSSHVDTHELLYGFIKRYHHYPFIEFFHERKKSDNAAMRKLAQKYLDDVDYDLINDHMMVKEREQVIKTYQEIGRNIP